MDNLLRYAYVEHRCNHCGGAYRVTLYEVLLEHRLDEEWQRARPTCATCGLEDRALLARVPRECLEQLAGAWDHVAATALAASVDLKTGC